MAKEMWVGQIRRGIIVFGAIQVLAEDEYELQFSSRGLLPVSFVSRNRLLLLGIYPTRGEALAAVRSGAEAYRAAAQTLVEQAAAIPDEPTMTCAGCEKEIWFRDSYSPPDTDEALCAECDTEVTGRVHLPSVPVTEDGLKQLHRALDEPAAKYGVVWSSREQELAQTGYVYPDVESARQAGIKGCAWFRIEPWLRNSEIHEELGTQVDWTAETAELPVSFFVDTEDDCEMEFSLDGSQVRYVGQDKWVEYSPTTSSPHRALSQGESHDSH